MLFCFSAHSPIPNLGRYYIHTMGRSPRRAQTSPLNVINIIRENEIYFHRRPNINMCQCSFVPQLIRFLLKVNGCYNSPGPMICHLKKITIIRNIHLKPEIITRCFVSNIAIKFV